MKPIIAGGLALFLGLSGAQAGSLAQQNAALLANIKRVHGLSDAQMARIRQIFAKSGIIGQGNPAITRHPMTEAQCRQRRGGSTTRHSGVCGAPNMVPLYDPKTQSPASARVCIDQYEFPDIACAYPVVWTKASEAAAICEAMGKRLCDAHEWEGACQGVLGPADYRFDLAGGGAAAMRSAHNAKYASSNRWSYGPAYKRGVCGANSTKTPGCNGGS
ncbi:MAG: hypothetical protein ACE5DK_10525, partial [Paracoccaceae bacterium]